MLAPYLRSLLHVIASPRRILIAAVLATFFYAALVATKARLFPPSGPSAGRVARPGERVHPAPERSGRPRAAAVREARSE
jgi:hypothetical protein